MSLVRNEFYRRIRSTLLRWELAAIGLVMAVLIIAALLSAGRFSAPLSRWLAYGSLVLLVGLITTSWAIGWQRLQRRLAVTESNLDETRARMTAAFRLSHRFAQAQDEKSVIEQALEICLEVVGVPGASFVPLNAGTKPLSTIVRGDLPPTVMADWGEYLATASAREACASCRDHTADASRRCPLLDGPFEHQAGIHCFPIGRGNKEMGMLNLYLPPGDTIETEALAFLSAMLDEMGVALEAIRLREREKSAAHQNRSVSKQELDDVIPVLLQGLADAVEARWAFLCLNEPLPSLEKEYLTAGNPPAWEVKVIQEVLQSVHGSMDPVLISASDLDIFLPDSEELEMVISPLCLPDGAVVGGVVLGIDPVWTAQKNGFSITRAISSQLAVAAHFARQVRTVEYQAVLAERTRLAREIHDGLAQTLGFLKLMTAQMQNYLVRGEDERLAGAMEMCRSALADAYLDTRQAIDGLRLSPENGLENWLVQAADEFAANHGLPVEIHSLETPEMLPIEIQSQMVRILQEALTNIRKHAQATRVMISCRVENMHLILEIEDDGRGFEPLDILSPARHGLKGMRERAELIHADLELKSGVEQGTTVRLSIPLEPMETLA